MTKSRVETNENPRGIIHSSLVHHRHLITPLITDFCFLLYNSNRTYYSLIESDNDTERMSCVDFDHRIVYSSSCIFSCWWWNMMIPRMTKTRLMMILWWFFPSFFLFVCLSHCLFSCFRWDDPDQVWKWKGNEVLGGLGGRETCHLFPVSRFIHLIVRELSACISHFVVIGVEFALFFPFIIILETMKHAWNHIWILLVLLLREKRYVCRRKRYIVST